MKTVPVLVCFLIMTGCTQSEPGASAYPPTKTNVSLISDETAPLHPTRTAAQPSSGTDTESLLPSTTTSITPTPTQTSQSPSTPEPTNPQPTILPDSRNRGIDGAGMVFVIGGTFQMGSTEMEIDGALELCDQFRGRGKCKRSWFEDESPVHKVTLDSFWIDRTEVTNRQFDQCVEAGGCRPVDCANEFPISEPIKPVGCVTWFDAMSYCEWAGVRLPTEAEWEYAARGVQRSIFPWGDIFDPSRLNYCDFNCTYKWHDNSYDDGYSWPAPVGSFETGVSWCGAQDMAGNNWEWIADWYDPGYYANSPAYNPPGPDSGNARVIRGGSCHFFPPYVRTARRSGIPPSGIYASGGFRCAADSALEPTSKEIATPLPTISNVICNPLITGCPLLEMDQPENNQIEHVDGINLEPTSRHPGLARPF